MSVRQIDSIQDLRGQIAANAAPKAQHEPVETMDYATLGRPRNVSLKSIAYAIPALDVPETPAVSCVEQADCRF
jgi:hypothetical protein